MEKLIMYQKDDATYFIPLFNKDNFEESTSKFKRAIQSYVIIWNDKIIKNRYGFKKSSRLMSKFLSLKGE